MCIRQCICVCIRVYMYELSERLILYNWTGIGWCAGRIRRPSANKGTLVQVDGVRSPANFMCVYDDGEGPHCLTLGKYGQGGVHKVEGWVLLEPLSDS